MVETRILRLKKVISRTGRSRSSIYADIKRGEFPKPISIGKRAVGWIESEIDDWISSRIEETRYEVL